MAKQIKNTTIQSSEPLTLTNLSNHDKQNDEIQTISLANGKFTLNINKTFRLTQIQKLIIDVQEASETMRGEQVDLEDISNMLLVYQMCIMKYFTSLPIKNLDLSDKKDLAKIIAAAKQLVDSGIFKEIMESFNPFELAKIEEMVKNSNVIGKQIGEMMTSIVLQNTDGNKEVGSELEKSDSDGGIQEP